MVVLLDVEEAAPGRCDRDVTAPRGRADAFSCEAPARAGDSLRGAARDGPAADALAPVSGSGGRAFRTRGLAA